MLRDTAQPQISRMAFNILPIELNQGIASFIADDRDLCAFRSICSATRNAIDGDKFSFWRSRFREHFDLVKGVEAEKLRRRYQHRMRHMRHNDTTRFSKGSERQSKSLLNIVKDLILESFNGDSKDVHGRPMSKNLQHLQRLALHGDIVKMFRPASKHLPMDEVRESPLLEVLQLVLSHLSLNFQMDAPEVHCFEASQKMTYASVEAEPIFKASGAVNYTWLRHTVNFFKYHFTQCADRNSLLPHFLADLNEDELPSAWTDKLVDEVVALDRFWKGTYAYQDMSDLREMRASDDGLQGQSDGHLADEDMKDPIQTLALDFAQAGDRDLFWPIAFEDHLNAAFQTKRQKSRRAQLRSNGSRSVPSINGLYFQGRGTDDEEFLSAGWLNQLPTQQGIPGWKRMTMMKYYRCEDTGAVDVDALWAYEGIVLPGNKIILGRWWAPGSDLDGQSYSGPFILWNVAPPKSERADSVMEG
ncbi:hypothetical protein EJ05DRAFT_181587 [Pseudovirgaria hyperparasitica]|uniref:F-box domain-containing protein n=1 Tax=Pseudovirgaria hyperparasitica TaxID=470096 RepID=A0A6A6WFV4_9PEZI|nr:uncharacterized protein EJ05DRAFT_181587 [Pseudovirgaria hyperparasitica]KAF2761678.1 hypothetical protein EJ05DRAFT_181587 [Pseudovirgaria hyperparasitica]